MAEYRNKQQIEADKLDLEVFRLCGALDRFANEHKLKDVHEMSNIIDGMRHRVRKHMHPKDAKEKSA